MIGPSQPHVPTSATDALGNVWSFAHNGHGQVTQVTPPAGSVLSPSSVTYDEAAGSATLGYPLATTDGNGDRTTFDAYDSLGDLLQVSTYPVHGDASTKNTTQFSYDAAQRLTQVTLPDGHTQQSHYSGRNLASSTDEAGTQYSYRYCASCGLMTGVSGPLGWSLGWNFDADHRLSHFTDANQNTTGYTYGNAGELTGVTYPDSSTQSFLYTAQGLMRQVTNGRGHAVSLGYDGAERLHTVTFPTSGQAGITLDYNADSSGPHGRGRQRGLRLPAHFQAARGGGRPAT